MAAWFPYDVPILLASLIYLVWHYFKNAFRKFEEDNIPHLKPIVPFGNATRSSLRLMHAAEEIDKVYHKFADHRYAGFYQMNSALLMIRDPEIIKQITIKDFDHFLNHRPFISEDHDALFGKNLFSMKDNKWRNMRSTLSPAFTGSKMRNMSTLMSDCAKQVNKYLMDSIEKSNKGKNFVTVDLKDLCTRYTSDIIATTVFGLKVDSLNEKKNEFYVTGLKASNFDGVAMLKFLLFVSFPKIAKFLKVRLFSDKVCNFFRNIVRDTMEYREKNKIYRPDMVHLMMEAKKGELKFEDTVRDGNDGFAVVEEDNLNKNGSTNTNWTDDDLTAQFVLFFIAGFETAANFMSFAIYELAMNKSVQNRLQEEIDASELENGNFYDKLQKISYLDMVISETLRKWPPSILTDRSCSKEYNLGPNKDGDDKGAKVKHNEVVWIPIYSIHRDPKYWPNPEKFDPERFSDENKDNIHPYTFLPFGVGPRNCIGNRYALMEAKVIIYYLLSKFNFKLNAKTRLPLKLVTNTFNLKPRGGFWIDFIPRNMTS